nr:glycosyltransferase family 2 protein [uncultured Carboxylicivirga sp.]
MSVSITNNLPLISIVIPVKNGYRTLESCIKGIKNQTVFNQCEIIIIDSGSTDGTLELLKNYPVDVYKIKPEEFNHGATRNYGVSLAKGKYVVMTVQDATPANEYWLGNMLRHFKSDNVAGVYGQQIVPHHKDKNPHQWFRPQSQPKIETRYFKNESIFERLSKKEKFDKSQWDDVSAMYRISVLKQIPFRAVNFAEDLLWAQDALRSGYKLIYDTNSRVEHYHHVTFKDQFKRTFTVLYHIYMYFNVINQNKYNLKTIPFIIYRNIKYKLPLMWIPYNIKIVTANVLANLIFRFVVIMNKKKLESIHSFICQTVPIGKLKK